MWPATPPRKNSLTTETETSEKTAPGDKREVDQATGFMKVGEPNPQGRLHPHGESNDTQNYCKHCMINSGCWNVRTLYYTGRLARVLREMHQYKISLGCVMESGWTGAGKRQLATGYTIRWLGRNDNQHRQEVALILQKGKATPILETNKRTTSLC